MDRDSSAGYCVRSLGAEIILPATPMDDVGHFATFKDTEGNILSLFAEN